MPLAILLEPFELNDQRYLREGKNDVEDETWRGHEKEMARRLDVEEVTDRRILSEFSEQD